MGSRMVSFADSQGLQWTWTWNNFDFLPSYRVLSLILWLMHNAGICTEGFGCVDAGCVDVCMF